MIQQFEIGDKVRIDGEQGVHVIKDIAVTRRPIGWHAIVRMEDGLVGMVDSSGFTDLKKV